MNSLLSRVNLTLLLLLLFPVISLLYVKIFLWLQLTVGLPIIFVDYSFGLISIYFLVAKLPENG